MASMSSFLHGMSSMVFCSVLFCSVLAETADLYSDL